MIHLPKNITKLYITSNSSTLSQPAVALLLGRHGIALTHLVKLSHHSVLASILFDGSNQLTDLIDYAHGFTDCHIVRVFKSMEYCPSLSESDSDTEIKRLGGFMWNNINNLLGTINGKHYRVKIVSNSIKLVRLAFITNMMAHRDKNNYDMVFYSSDPDVVFNYRRIQVINSNITYHITWLCGVDYTNRITPKWRKKNG